MSDRLCPECNEPIYLHEYREDFVGVEGKNNCNIGTVVEKQAAEISRLTAAERLLRAVAANLEIADKSGENWLRVFVAVETAAEIVAFCTPQPQPAQAESYFGRLAPACLNCGCKNPHEVGGKKCGVYDCACENYKPEPETPVLSRYAADIAALAAGEITEEQFCARQGRKPI